MTTKVLWGFAAGLALFTAAGCGGTSYKMAEGGHEGHAHALNEKGEWTCSHCGGSYDAPGKCKNDYCKMDLVKKAN